MVAAHLPPIPDLGAARAMNRTQSRTVAWKYNAMRRVLVWLRRISLRYAINFDNAAESSRKEPSWR